MTDAMYLELLSVIGLANQNNHLATALAVEIDAAFRISLSGSLRRKYSRAVIIAGVKEVVCTFACCDGVEDWTDSIVDGLCGSHCGLAQPMFELGEELFDRVQIG
jgi:hypothetical protein